MWIDLEDLVSADLDLVSATLDLVSADLDLVSATPDLVSPDLNSALSFHGCWSSSGWSQESLSTATSHILISAVLSADKTSVMDRVLERDCLVLSFYFLYFVSKGNCISAYVYISLLLLCTILKFNKNSYSMFSL